MNLEQPDKPFLAAGEAMPADLWVTIGATAHPVAPLPDADWLRRHPLSELLQFLEQREETIRRMAEDPYRYGYEPQTWRIMDALCGFPWIDHRTEAIAVEMDPARRAAMVAEKAWCLKVRRGLLKQDEAVRVLLVNGGNRGGKSEWAASRVMKLLMWKRAARAWCFHQDEAMSVEYQQPLLYKYMPPELKTDKGIRKANTYIAYKRQTGFSEGRFGLPNLADCSFRNYEQKEEKIEGGELDVIWCDELVPASWIKTLRARIATRGGWLLITFTPVRGYTPTVKMFLDMATPTLKSTAFLLPKDGGEALLDLALRGEDVQAWVEGRPAQPPVPAGREFEEVPRIMRCTDRRSAVFFIHSTDNPFGNPRELWALMGKLPVDERRMRFYGLAIKALSSQFPKFNALVHVITQAEAAAMGRGTRYHIVDPCSGRNWAMGWAKVVNMPRGKTYVIDREWPCPGRYVPGEGDLGAWAEPGDKHDGERGPAQQPLGWGLKRYKGEILRLEGRQDWELASADEGKPFRFDEDDEPEYTAPRPRRKAAAGDGPEVEDVYERIMDSRYGATPTQTREGSTTLLEAMADLGMDFVPASGGAQADDTKVHWIHLINDLLDYTPPAQGEKMDPMQAPRLYITEDCLNHIFAMQNWTGADGAHGACKDFIDLIKYLVLADCCEDWSGTKKDAA